MKTGGVTEDESACPANTHQALLFGEELFYGTVGGVEADIDSLREGFRKGAAVVCSWNIAKRTCALVNVAKI